MRRPGPDSRGRSKANRGPRSCRGSAPPGIQPRPPTRCEDLVEDRSPPRGAKPALRSATSVRESTMPTKPAPTRPAPNRTRRASSAGPGRLSRRSRASAAASTRLGAEGPSAPPTRSPEHRSGLAPASPCSRRGQGQLRLVRRWCQTLRRGPRTQSQLLRPSV